LLVQLLQRKAGELLGLFFGVAVVGDAVAAQLRGIRARLFERRVKPVTLSRRRFC
jgi:hypothetical protein